MRPKVLLIAPYFPPHVGGAENYVYNIGKTLQQLYGWDVVVVTSNTQSRKRMLKVVEGMRVHYLPRWFMVSNTPINLSWYNTLREIIDEEQPDIVNAHTPVPFISDIAGLVTGRIPFVLTYHAGALSVSRGIMVDVLSHLYERFFAKYVLGRADVIISSSEFVRTTFLKGYLKKTITITPGVDTERFRPRRARPGRKVLFVASLKKAERYKGLEFLLKAMQRIRTQGKEVQLDVVGDGDFREFYERMASDLGVKDIVHFHGRLDGQDLVNAYQSCDVFVLPSLYDSWPLVLLEAMACGKPVLGSDTSGIPYVIDDGKTGYVFPPKDHVRIAEQIIDLLDHPKKAQALGAAGRSLMEQSYAWSIKAAQANHLMRTLIHAPLSPTKHKLLLVTPYFMPNIGGVETYTRNVAEGMRDRGWEVTVVTSAIQGNAPRLPGIRIIRLPYWFKLSNTPVHPGWIGQLRAIIELEKPTVINAHMPVPFMADAAVIAAGNMPVVITYHAGTMKKNSFSFDLLVQAYESIVLKRTLGEASRIICSSEFVRSDFLSWTKEKSITVTPGVDEKVFVPTRKYPRNTILYVGRLERSSSWKGVPYLLAAFRILLRSAPDARLIIAGDGDQREALEREARTLKIEHRTTFTGSLRDQKLVKVYQEASVLALPSTSDAESFGLVLIEAGACGRPTVGSDVGGIPYVIKNFQTGLIVPPRDPTALANALLRLLQDPARAARMGAQGRKLVLERYTWQQQLDKYEQVLKEAERA